MKQTINYDIHNIIQFKIIIDDLRPFVLLQDLDDIFSFFKIEEQLKRADIILRIGKFTPSNRNCYIVDNKYHFREDYMCWEERDIIGKWKTEISGFEQGQIIIKYYERSLNPKQMLVPYFLPQSFLLKPYLEYALWMSGYSWLHSSGVSKDNQAYLFAGSGGAFKTTLAMYFLKNADFSLLGDDRVILHGREVLSFPMSLVTFKFQIKYMNNEFYGFSDKVRLMKYLLIKKFQAREISVSKNAQLKAVFIPVVKMGQREPTIRDLEPQLAAKRITMSQKIEMIKADIFRGGSSRYLKHLLAYSSTFPSSSMANYLMRGPDIFENTLTKIFKGTPTYEIVLPPKFDVNVFKIVHNFITTL